MSASYVEVMRSVQEAARVGRLSAVEAQLYTDRLRQAAADDAARPLSGASRVDQVNAELGFRTGATPGGVSTTPDTTYAAASRWAAGANTNNGVGRGFATGYGLLRG